MKLTDRHMIQIIVDCLVWSTIMAEPSICAFIVCLFVRHSKFRHSYCSFYQRYLFHCRDVLFIGMRDFLGSYQDLGQCRIPLPLVLSIESLLSSVELNNLVLSLDELLSQIMRHQVLRPCGINKASSRIPAPSQYRPFSRYHGHQPRRMLRLCLTTRN